MKKTIQLQTLVAISLMIFVTSCTKESSVVITPVASKTQESARTAHKLMNVLLYTKSSYDKHDAHSYAEGHILEFSSNWKLLKAENTIKIQNALAYMHNAALTGDTTGQYLNLFTYVLPNSVYMDAYPDSALIYGKPASYSSFCSWFQSTCMDWLAAHQCTKIVINKNTEKYIMKIHCEPQ